MYKTSLVGLCGLLALAMCSEHARATIVYNSLRTGTPNGTGTTIERGNGFLETSSSSEAPGGLENYSQLAQRIILAGTERRVTSVSMHLGAWAFSGIPTPASSTADVVISLYANDGLPNVPGSMLATSTSASQAFSVTNSQIRTFLVSVPFAEVVVPDSFFIAVSFANVTGDGLPLGTEFNLSSPTIGSVAPGRQWLFQSSTDQSWAVDPLVVSSVLEFQVEAVPGPGGMAALLAGLCALSRRRAR